MSSFSTLSILKVDLLQSTPYLEQTYHSRKVISLGIAEQFFTCFLSRQGWNDAWLTQGISSYLSGLHVKKLFGNNEYRHWIHKVMKLGMFFLLISCGQYLTCIMFGLIWVFNKELEKVVDYEEKVGGGLF